MNWCFNRPCQFKTIIIHLTNKPTRPRRPSPTHLYLSSSFWAAWGQYVTTVLFSWDLGLKKTNSLLLIFYSILFYLVVQLAFTKLNTYVCLIFSTSVLLNDAINSFALDLSSSKIQFGLMHDKHFSPTQTNWRGHTKLLVTVSLHLNFFSYVWSTK